MNLNFKDWTATQLVIFWLVVSGLLIVTGLGLHSILESL
jgi:hypothetical protein